MREPACAWRRPRFHLASELVVGGLHQVCPPVGGSRLGSGGGGETVGWPAIGRHRLPVGVTGGRSGSEPGARRLGGARSSRPATPCRGAWRDSACRGDRVRARRRFWAPISVGISSARDRVQRGWRERHCAHTASAMPAVVMGRRPYCGISALWLASGGWADCTTDSRHTSTIAGTCSQRTSVAVDARLNPFERGRSKRRLAGPSAPHPSAKGTPRANRSAVGAPAVVGASVARTAQRDLVRFLFQHLDREQLARWAYAVRAHHGQSAPAWPIERGISTLCLIDLDAPTARRYLNVLRHRRATGRPLLRPADP